MEGGAAEEGEGFTRIYESSYRRLAYEYVFASRSFERDENCFCVWSGA